MGPIGNGELAKSCNQAIVASTAALWAEVIAYARRCDLDPDLLVDALAGGWADSAIRRVHGHDLVAGVSAAPRGPSCSRTSTSSATLRAHEVADPAHLGGDDPVPPLLARVRAGGLGASCNSIPASCAPAARDTAYALSTRPVPT